MFMNFSTKSHMSPKAHQKFLLFVRLLFSVLCISTTKITCRKGFGVRNSGSCVYTFQLETANTITIWNANLPADVPLANRYRLVLRVKEPSFLQVQSTSPSKFSVTAKKLSLLILVPRKIIPMDSSKVRDHTCLLAYFDLRFFIGHSTQSSQCEFSVKYSVYIS